MFRTQLRIVSRHLDKFIFQFAWELLSSVALLLGGHALAESFQIYAFVGEICESFFRAVFEQVELYFSEFRCALDQVFERKHFLQINDPLVI